MPPANRGQVLIRVQACGVCHTDSFTVQGTHPAVTFPRVVYAVVKEASKPLMLVRFTKAA